MALETSLKNLVKQLECLEGRLAELSLSVVEDKPRNADLLLTGQLSDALDELNGRLAEAAAAAQDGHGAARHPADWEAARLCLTSCQEHFNMLAQSFSGYLGSYEQWAELARLGQARRGEWQAWGEIVRDNIGRCRAALEEATFALFQCWQELAECGSRAAVTVHTRNIGQQIMAPESTLTLREAAP